MGLIDRFRSGITPSDIGIPAYGNWDDFEPDHVDPTLDGDNSALADEHKGVIDPGLLKKHREEK